MLTDYEFLILYYLLTGAVAEDFGPHGEFTVTAYPQYNKSPGDNCLDKIGPNSPIKKLVEDIRAGSADLQRNAINLLYQNKIIFIVYIKRVNNLAVL